MNYQDSLKQAIIYIENHLHEDITVEQVASFIGYSYYHFNRQFIAVLGETIGSYIKKRRLASAAKKLLYTDTKIVNIAMENNFESAEAFSRAFKTMYKVSPKTYRENHKHTYVSTKESLDTTIFEHLVNHITVHPKIMEIKEIKVVGLQKQVSLQLEDIKDFREEGYTKLKPFSLHNKKQRRFGIYEIEDAYTHFTINGDMICNQVVAIESFYNEDIQDPFIIKTIPAGRYAVFSHMGSLTSLQQTINYIWGTWLLSTKEKVDNRDTFEVYDERFLGFNNPDSIIDIYVSIK